MLLSVQVHAQAPYTGGNGDGYATSRTSFTLGQPQEGPTDVTFALSEDLGNWTLVLLISGSAEQVEVDIYDVKGAELGRETLPVPANRRLEYPLGNFASALYLIRVIPDGSEPFTEKIANPYRLRE